MWSAVMFAPSSVRSRFSSSTFRLYGRRAEPSTLSSRKISYDSSPTCSVLRASKLFADTTVSFIDVRVTTAILTDPPDRPEAGGGTRTGAPPGGYLDVEINHSA